MAQAPPEELDTERLGRKENVGNEIGRISEHQNLFQKGAMVNPTDAAELNRMEVITHQDKSSPKRKS